MGSFDLTIATDGACRDNQNEEKRRASAGYLIDEGDKRIHEGSVFLGRGPEWTNNRAEYQAAIKAVEWVQTEYNASNGSIILLSDSELMTKQLQGEYDVNSPSIIEVYKILKSHLDEFKDIETEHRSAQDGNRIDRADELANSAFDN
jgi:ribonuclease HI